MTPQQNWVATTDGSHGLALLAPGQYESAVLDQPDRPLCLTLLRGFRRAVFTDGNEGGQIPGVHKFRLGLKPFDGPVPATDLFQLAQTLAAPPRADFVDANDMAYTPKAPARRLQELPAVRGKAVFSACYVEDNQWVFRVFNPTDKPETLQLDGGNTWEVVDLRARLSRRLDATSIKILPRQILTLQATVGSPKEAMADHP